MLCITNLKCRSQLVVQMTYNFTMPLFVWLSSKIEMEYNQNPWIWWSIWRWWRCNCYYGHVYEIHEPHSWRETRSHGLRRCKSWRMNFHWQSCGVCLSHELSQISDFRSWSSGEIWCPRASHSSHSMRSRCISYVFSAKKSLGWGYLWWFVDAWCFCDAAESWDCLVRSPLWLEKIDQEVCSKDAVRFSPRSNCGCPLLASQSRDSCKLRVKPKAKQSGLLKGTALLMEFAFPVQTFLNPMGTRTIASSLCPSRHFLKWPPSKRRRDDDKLTVNGKQFSGTSLLGDSFNAWTNITWRSDESVVERGWQFCLVTLTCADGLPLIPVAVRDCPPGSAALPSCDEAAPGDLCEGDGKCGTRTDRFLVYDFEGLYICHPKGVCYYVTM